MTDFLLTVGFWLMEAMKAWTVPGMPNKPMNPLFCLLPITYVCRSLERGLVLSCTEPFADLKLDMARKIPKKSLDFFWQRFIKEKTQKGSFGPVPKNQKTISEEVREEVQMSSITKFLKVAAGVALVSTAAISVPAALLAPGQTLFPVPQEVDPIGGTVLHTQNSTFSSSSFSGFLTSKVISGDTSNPFGNGLTFTYQFTLTGGPQAASQFTVTSFGDFLVDVSYNALGGAAPLVVPTMVNRSVLGDVIRFGFFGNDVQPGSTSALLVAQTSSSRWTLSDAALIDGQSVNTVSVAPLPIPEPGSLSLLAVGLGVLAVARRRR